MAVDPLAALSSMFNPAPALAQAPQAAPAAGAPADPAQDPSNAFAGILAKLRGVAQQGVTPNAGAPMSTSPLGTSLGAVPDVKGLGRGQAFISGLSSGMKANAARTDSLATAKAAADVANRNYQLEVTKQQWAQTKAQQEQLEKKREFDQTTQNNQATAAENKRYHDILGDYYKGQNDKKGDADAMGPRDQVLTEQRLQDMSGYKPGDPSWQILPQAERDMRFQRFQSLYQSYFKKPYPIDSQGKPLPPSTPPKAAADGEDAATPSPTGAAPPAAPQGAGAPSSGAAPAPSPAGGGEFMDTPILRTVPAVQPPAAGPAGAQAPAPPAAAPALDLKPTEGVARDNSGAMWIVDHSTGAKRPLPPQGGAAAPPPANPVGAPVSIGTD